jgi:hypothetical protein
MIQKLLLTPAFLLLLQFSLSAQSIRINEVCSSNISTVVDQDEDTPDWFELENVSSESINLKDYKISDHRSLDHLWSFPNIVIPASSHLLVFASGKNRVTPPSFWNTLIDRGQEWSYIIPTTEPNANWNTIGYDDSNWQKGNSGFGYGDEDDNTELEPCLSVFIRKKFEVTDISSVTNMVLHMDYDDGFVAYINGNEVARSGLNGTRPPFNAEATSHEAAIYAGGTPEMFDLVAHISTLVEGTNVISIQVHNTSSTSSDLTAIPILSIATTKVGDQPKSEYLTNTNIALHTDFKLSSEGDSLFLYAPDLTLVDSLIFGPLNSDISYGYDQNGQLSFFDVPTPGSANITNAYVAQAAPVAFSIPSGMYQQPFELTMQAEGASIYYTTDGSIPSDQSNPYSLPISITQTTVIRAIAISDGHMASKLTSATYLVGVNHQTRVVSLITDPSNFFDYNTGMLELGPEASADFPYFGANFWNDWEKPVHFMLFDKSGEMAFEANAGASVFGAYSRGNAQKSMAIYFRNKYGDGPTEYQLFENKKLEEYSSIVLRNSGNDWNNTMLRDAFQSSLFHESLDKQSYSPSVVYINGTYWGILNMREKINEHFIANNRHIDSESITILEGKGDPIIGENSHYANMINYVSNRQTLTDSDISYLSTQMDIMNFIYYQTGNIYIDNTDWPGNNIKFWRENTPEGVWRWLCYDTDFGYSIWGNNNYKNNTLAFATATNGPSWPNPDWSTLLLRKLLTNQKIKNLFINTMADQLNTTWLPKVAIANLDAKVAGISGEIQAHLNRWGGSYDYWQERILVMNNYAKYRPANLKTHIEQQFNLSGRASVTLNISNEAHGFVKINTLIPNTLPWSGDYFKGIPITLEAVAAPGHSFVKWEGIESVDAKVNVTLTSGMNFKAIFEENKNDILNKIIVNEIMYKSEEGFDPGDWIELFNNSNETIDLSHWILKDSDDEHSFVIPAGTVIEAKKFLILCQNKADFEGAYTITTQKVGDFEFGLSSNGDCVRLYNSDNYIVEEVCYQAENPWPVLSNDEGHTLALKSMYFDNHIPESWYAKPNHGNPGESNETFVLSANDDLSDFNVFPNPMTDQINIRLKNKLSESVFVELFNINGHSIERRVFLRSEIDNGLLSWKSNAQIPAGLYILQINDGIKSYNFRVIKQ